MERLNVGDLVQLKSGGPIMTIATVYEEKSPSQQIRFYYLTNKTKYPDAEYMYLCTWFVKDNIGNDISSSELYPEGILVKVK